MKNRFFLIVLLGLLMTVSPISIDMYLPAFNQMARALHGSAADIALSLTSYFVGLAAGQLFYGPLLDRFGRRVPVLAGLGLYLLATIGCMSAQSVSWLIVARFFQAFGGCAAQVGATAMVRDFFPPEESAKIFSMLMLVLGVSPLLAPSIGNFVVENKGWQAVFVILFFANLLIAANVAMFLPEGHRPDPKISLKIGPIFSGFASIFADRRFAVYALAGAFSFAGLFVYVTGSPLIFMDHFHLSAGNYSKLFALLAIGFIGSAQINSLLGKKFKPETVFVWALGGQCIAGVALVAVALTGATSLPITIALFFIYLSSLGIASPNASAVALAPFGDIAGSAAALLGFLQIGAGAFASSAIGLVHAEGITKVAAVLCVSTLIAAVVLVFGRAKGVSVNRELA